MHHPGQQAVDVVLALLPDLLVHDAVEDEDEEALEGVEEGEDVCDGDGGVGDGQKAYGPGGPEKEEQSEEALDIELEGGRPGLVGDEGVPAVDVDLPDCHTQEVDVDTDDTEDGGEEGEDEVDVAPDPAELAAAVHADVVEEGVDQEGEEDHEQGRDVAEHVVLHVSVVVRLEDLHKEHVDLEASDEHPEEGGEEEVVEDDRHHGAEGGEVGLADAEEEDELGDEETGAEVGVDGGAVVLGAPEGGEDPDTDDEADEADAAADVCEDVEGALVLLPLGEAVHVDQHGEVSEVVTLAGRTVRRGPLQDRVAAGLGPCVQLKVPVYTLPGESLLMLLILLLLLLLLMYI